MNLQPLGGTHKTTAHALSRSLKLVHRRHGALSTIRRFILRVSKCLLSILQRFSGLSGLGHSPLNTLLRRSKITRRLLRSRTLLQKLLLSLLDRLNALSLGLGTLTSSCLDSLIRRLRLELLLRQLRLGSLKLLGRLQDAVLRLLNSLRCILDTTTDTLLNRLTSRLRSLRQRLCNLHLNIFRDVRETRNHWENCISDCTGH